MKDMIEEYASVCKSNPLPYKKEIVSNMSGKKINVNGYGYVNLDLPSKTLWATCNVGADKPSDFGLYFQWGDTVGYSNHQIGLGDGQKKFSSDFSDYKWHNAQGFTRYKTAGDALQLDDDAANANMGGDWHMPSPEQIQELIDNTTNTWTEQNGVKGKLLISKSDTSKTIFFPAAGFAWNGSVYNSGSNGLVWSSMLNAGNVDYGQNLYFYSSNVILNYYCRYSGLSVRGVIG